MSALSKSATVAILPHDRENLDTGETILSIGIFVFCSISMMVTNKLAITAFPYESTLTALQMAFAVLLLLCFAFRSIHIGSLKDVLRWSMVAPFFAGMLLTNMLALKHCTLTLVIVCKTMSPIFTLMAESFYANVQVNLQMVASLLIMLLGAVLYTRELKVEHLVGVRWLTVNVSFSVLTRLLQRRLLADNRIDISKSGCSLISNALGILPLILTAYLTGELEADAAPQKLTSLSNLEALVLPIVRVNVLKEMCFIIVSCVVGLGINYTTIWCQSLISATSMLVLINANRFVVILIEAFFLHRQTSDHRPSATQLAGAMVTVLGGIALAAPQRDVKHGTRPRHDERKEYQPAAPEEQSSQEILSV